MSTLTDPVAELSPREKRALLTRLLRQREEREREGLEGRDDLPRLVPDPANRHQPFPLTDIQQAYWVGRGEEFVLGGVGIHGYFEVDCLDLDLERLNRAWQRAVERHDMMRVVVLPEGRQRVLPEVPFYRFEERDLSAATPEEVEAEIAAQRERMSHQVFDPGRWPLFEIRATRLDGRRVRLHLSEDALHVDLMSSELIYHDWLFFYENPEADLPPPMLSYRDYVLALDELRQTGLYRRSLAYWQERVETLPAAPRLPTRVSPEALERVRFRRRATRLPAAVWRRLKERGGELGLTPSSLLLAGYAEVMAAWSEEPRFTLNVTLFNRLPLHPEIDGIAGDFTSMVLLEVDGRADAPFVERARRLQQRLWTDLEYRHASGVEVLRELARRRGGGTAALMPVVFTGTLGTTGYRALERLGEIVYGVTQTPQVTLDQQVFEEGGDLVLSWDAVEDLFPPGLVGDMFGAYEGLLRRLAEDGAAWQAVERRLVPPAQRALRAEINATAAPSPEEALGELFARRAARHGDRVALAAAGGSLSYGELERRSARLARRLLAAGARREEPVAVVMAKGVEQVVAVLGTLRAGAAYLPVDPALPVARRRLLLEDVGARFARVAAGWWGAARPAGVRWMVVSAASLSAAPAPSREGELPRVEAANLAYVLYTSGSTGRPKGVMIEHRSVTNRMADVVARFGLTGEDRAIALTALGHDLSVFDLFGMLAVAGGSLAIPETERLRDPAHWLDLLTRRRVTVWNSVPAFAEMLATYAEGGGVPLPPPPLRRVMLSGDWIPVPLPDRLRALAPAARVISLGGPTETTVWDIHFPVAEVDPAWPSIPYGKPLANAAYHVLKDDLEPCPTWVPGELYMSGAGLARGYWGDEARTAERFLIHPETGERLYKSGDRGCYLPGGDIRFLGRRDLQLKVRGHRVEPAEVEAALLRHPRVEAAVVGAVGEAAAERRLVAWVVPRRDGGPPEAAGGAFSQGELEGLELALERPGLRRGSKPARPLARPPGGEALRRAYERRRSHRAFRPRPVAAETLGRFLGCLMALDEPGAVLPRYRYPSAASLYPVQVYLHVQPGRVEGLAAGFYYYQPDEHGLVPLAPGVPLDSSIHAPRNREIFEGAAFSLFLVGKSAPVASLYGAERAREFCLLEAGYMGQLLMTEAPDHGLGLCPLGGLDFDVVRPHLALAEGDLFLHSFCGGLAVAGAAEGGEGGDEAAIATGESGGAPSDFLAGLRRLAAAELPEALVPSTFVLLAELPLGANGKVDRAALPAPEAVVEGGGREGAPRAPRSGLEETVAAAWREALEGRAVGLDDNLFDRGATSMHVVQVCLRLRQELDREVAVVDLFRHPTVAGLAAFLARHGEDAPDAAADAAAAGRERARDRIEARRAALERRRRREDGDG